MRHLRKNHCCSTSAFQWRSLPAMSGECFILWSTFAEVTTIWDDFCDLTAPSHYLNQCWLVIKCFLWHLPERNVARSATLSKLPPYRPGASELIQCGLVMPYDEWHRLGSTLAEGVAWCPTAPSHYLNQFGLMISEVLWHSPDSNFTENT